ncbi:MAG: AMP-dependent synthetase/ligase [Candidatus Velthaea sp.]
MRASELSEAIDTRALGLRAAGVGPGDRVALMSPNRVDWIVTNLAILRAGGVTVPIYATQAHDQVAYILTDCAATLLVVDSLATRDALSASGLTLPPVLSFDGAGNESLAALESTGRAARAAEPGTLQAIAAAIKPDDLAMLIYTSGTTGQPKGVMLSHGNISSNAIDSFSLVDTTILPGDAVLSVLPFAHIYESTNMYGYLLSRTVIYVNHKIEAMLDDLRSVKPAALFGVPRIYERMLVAIRSKAKARGGLKAKLIPWALDAGRDYMRLKTANASIAPALRLQYALAHALALKKIRSMLGLENLKLFVSGSAPLHPDTAFTFMAFDCSIMEGYGLTECAPVVTANHPDRTAIGSVGPAIANVEIKLAADGELLVRGPNVMKGYYRDPEATAKVIVDGWFHTGDIAEIAADGYVRITDRKRELFKTSGGKFIAPSRVESAILRSLYVNQTMVVGNGKPHPAALVSLNWANLRAELQLPENVPAAVLAERADVREFMQREIMTQTGDLAKFEQIRTVGILPRDLTIEDGELSPTQKIKRRVVEQRYASLIDELFRAMAA